MPSICVYVVVSMDLKNGTYIVMHCMQQMTPINIHTAGKTSCVPSGVQILPSGRGAGIYLVEYGSSMTHHYHTTI